MDINKTMEDHIPGHLRNPKMTNVINSFITEFTAIENDITDINNAIFIDTAQGDELDTLGAFFQMVRETGETDVSYRSRIKKARDKANVCGVRKLIEVYLQDLLGPYATVTEDVTNPLVLTVKIPLGSIYPLSAIQELVDNIKMAGVKVFYTTDVYGAETTTIYDTISMIDLNDRFLADIDKPEAGVWLS
jgi:hypothetical protein